MKFIKKLIPITAFVSTLAVATPAIASCSCSFDSNEITVTPTAGYEFIADDEGKVEIEFELNSSIDNDNVYAQIFNSSENKINASFYAIQLERAKVVDKKFKFKIYFEKIPNEDISSVFSLQIQYKKDGKDGKAITKPITISFERPAHSFVDVTKGHINKLSKVDGNFASVNDAISAYADAVNSNKNQLIEDIYCYFGTLAKNVGQATFEFVNYERFDVLVLNPSVELDTTLVDGSGNYVLKVSFDLRLHNYLNVSSFVWGLSWGQEIETEMHFEDVPFIFCADVVWPLTYYTLQVWVDALDGSVTYSEPWSISCIDQKTEYDNGNPTIVSVHDFIATDPTSWDQGSGIDSAVMSVQPNIFACSISPWLSLPTDSSKRKLTLAEYDDDDLYADIEDFATTHNAIEGYEYELEQIIGLSAATFIQTDEQPYRIEVTEMNIHGDMSSGYWIRLVVPKDITPNTTFRFTFTLEANSGAGCSLIPESEWIGKNYELVYIPE